MGVVQWIEALSYGGEMAI